MPRLLVVSRNEALCGRYAALLEADGHEVHAAGSACDAADRVASAPPDLVILDPRLQAVDALGSFLAALHADGKVPVVLHAGDADLAVARLAHVRADVRLDDDADDAEVCQTVRSVLTASRREVVRRFPTKASRSG